ncbi:hypothetical protein [Pseudomonas parafulva]|uniref:hypothetical protein n=1 Tax=Pseudomonas parafulva TaxID=157782 RepID=UPI00048F5224|nr:hypothetical protein [Pseudomonas parafulva]
MTQSLTATQFLSQADELTRLLRSIKPNCESQAKSACCIAILQASGYVLSPAGPAEAQAELDRAAKLYGFADQVY